MNNAEVVRRKPRLLALVGLAFQSDRTATEVVFATETRIVGSFLRDDDVMGVTLLNRSSGNLDKACLGAQFVDGVRTAVTHTGPKTSNKLKHVIRQGSLVGDTPLDPFGNELLDRSRLAVLVILGPHAGFLSIALVRALGHRS